MEKTKGGKRTSAYTDPKSSSPKKKRKNPTRDLTVAGAMKNVLKIATRAQ